MEHMGNLLLSGDGKKNYLYIAVHIAASIVILAAYYFTWGLGAVLLGVAIFFILFDVYILLSRLRRAKTEIYVYENGIHGIGIMKKPYSLAEFQAPYDEISQVDMSDRHAVTISIAGGTYSCYPADKKVIRSAINEKVFQAKLAQNSEIGEVC